MPGIKEWLETIGEPVEETAFPPGSTPPLPFIIYLDSTRRGGGDMKNLITFHSLTIERYSDGTGDEAVDELLDAGAIKYSKEKQWLHEEQCFMTTYTLESEIIEREVI